MPPRVEYRLSELGKTLRPVIGVSRDWGVQYKAMIVEEKMPQGRLLSFRRRATRRERDAAES